jgi:hypothetical protein
MASAVFFLDLKGKVRSWGTRVEELPTNRHT